MIIQKFYPVNSLLVPMWNLCMQDHEAYFMEQSKLDSSIISRKILSSEEDLLDTLEKLSLCKREKDVIQCIQSLDQEQCFLLYVSIATAFVHYHADVELLPLIPDDNVYPLLFAYLQEGYRSFRMHCEKHQLDIWWELLDFVVDPYFLES